MTRNSCFPSRNCTRKCCCWCQRQLQEIYCYETQVCASTNNSHQNAFLQCELGVKNIKNRHQEKLKKLSKLFAEKFWHKFFTFFFQTSRKKTSHSTSQITWQSDSPTLSAQTNAFLNFWAAKENVFRNSLEAKNAFRNFSEAKSDFQSF